ncbi:MAG: hypothetical protein WDN72_00800 [Alphaproteobacteria bacterium]
MPISPAELAELKVDVKRAKAGVPILVREHLSWEQMASIEYHLPLLPTAFIDEGPVAALSLRRACVASRGLCRQGRRGRDRRLRRAAAAPAGFPHRQERRRGAVRGPVARHGGDAPGRGQRGGLAGARARQARTPVPGQALSLSVDSRLQEFLVERMGEESGAVVVMNIHTGEILALVSVPGL